MTLEVTKLLELEENKIVIDTMISQNEQIIMFALFDLMKAPSYADQFKMSRFVLINKLLNHAATQHILAKGNKLTYNGKEELVYDLHSIMSLQRTVFENYLTFYSIFIAQQTEEAKQFRFNVFNFIERKAQHDRNKGMAKDAEILEINRMSGANLTINIDQIVILLREQMDYFQRLVTEDRLYETLTRDQKKKINGSVTDWKIDGSWYVLAEKAKFNMASFSYKYNILSSSVHSGLQSTVLFNFENLLDKDYLSLILGTLLESSMIFCRALMEYYEISSDKDRIKRNEEMFKLIKAKAIMGIQIGLFRRDEDLIKYLNEY